MAAPPKGWTQTQWKYAHPSHEGLLRRFRIIAEIDVMAENEAAAETDIRLKLFADYSNDRRMCTFHVLLVTPTVGDA